MSKKKNKVSEPVTKVFIKADLGSFFKSNERPGIWTLRRSPITSKGKRYKYLLNTSDPTMIITEFNPDSKEEWTEVDRDGKDLTKK